MCTNCGLEEQPGGEVEEQHHDFGTGSDVPRIFIGTLDLRHYW